MIRSLVNNKNVRTVVAAVLITPLLLTIVLGSYLEFHYDAVMPRSPQPQTTRVYRLMVKGGSVVYVNQREFDLLNFIRHYMLSVSGICAMFAFLLMRDKLEAIISRENRFRPFHQ